MASEYDKLLNEFDYKNFKWCDWTTLENLKFIEDKFIFREDDILLVSYPKCGNTIISEMLWLLRGCFETGSIKETFSIALSESLFTRVPFLEVTNLKFPFKEFQTNVIPMEYLKTSRTKGDIIKTHLPWSVLKETFNRHYKRNLKFPKIVFITRNPKDALVSMDNFYRLCEELGPYNKGFDDFFKMWMDGCIVNGDYRSFHLDWYRGFKELDQLSSIYKVFYYEDCVDNPTETLHGLVKLLYENTFSENLDQMFKDIIEHTRFDRMKNNKMVNYEGMDLMVKGVSFMRKGVVGDWRNHFTQDQNSIFNESYQDFFYQMEQLSMEYVERIKEYI